MTRLFYSNASNWYQNVKTKNYCEINGKGKKSYNERINIGHGTFTPLVILANGGMSRGCQTFYTKLPEKIPEKACQSNSVFSSCIVDSVKKKFCDEVNLHLLTWNCSLKDKDVMDSISKDADGIEESSSINAEIKYS